MKQNKSKGRKVCPYCKTPLVNSPLATENLDIYYERYINQIRSKRFDVRSIRKNLSQARENLWDLLYRDKHEKCAGACFCDDPTMNTKTIRAIFDLLIGVEGLYRIVEDSLDRELIKHGQNPV